jgi:hypothetical protein
MFRAFGCTAFAALLILTPQAQTGTTIRIWKVGSPHTEDTPHAEMPPALAREAGSRGWRLSINAFPAQAFAGRFFAASRNGSAPDVLVLDNFGTMDGIVTELGSFVGIGQDPVIRNQLIQVTSSFDELLGPARGWIFLITSSANYAAARELALRTPRCEDASSARSLTTDLAVPEVAAAYLAGDNAGILRHADPERLSGLRRNLEPVTVGSVAVCGRWGNERLAFAMANASYQADTTIGHAPLLLGFRKTTSLWRLLVAARDPVSNHHFVTLLPGLSKILAHDIPAGPLPTPATLRSPPNGRFPVPPNGARFGDFEWQSSTSGDVVVEIAEFSYHDDARLFLLRPRKPGVPQHISAGQLWSTRGEWAWRVWSITMSGEIAFSEVRTFVH